MRFFSSKSKSYGGKDKSPHTIDLTKSKKGLDEHKSLFSFSPIGSLVIGMNNNKGRKGSSPENNDSEPEQEQLEDKSFPGFSPQAKGKFKSVQKVIIVDDGPDISRFSRVSNEMNVDTTENINTTTRPLGHYHHRSTDKGKRVTVVLNSAGKPKSLTDFGPDCGELSDKDAIKGIKIPAKTLDFNPFFEKRKTNEDPELCRDGDVPISTMRPLVELMPQTENSEVSGSKRLNGSFGRTSENNKTDEIKDTKSVSGILLNGKAASELRPRTNNPVSVVFLDTEGQEDLSVKRTVTENQLVTLSNEKDERLDTESQVQLKESTKNKKRSKEAKNGETKGKEKKTVFYRIDLDTNEKLKPKPKPILLLITLYVVLIYGALPIVMFFSAYAYEGEKVRALLNFGVLGIIQGAVQVLLLRHLIDLPILNKIADIEGKNRGLIDPKKYLVLNKFGIICIVGIATGIQIAAGIIMASINVTINANRILLSSLGITFVEGVFWFCFIWANSPSTAKNEEKFLVGELKEINQIRKDFMADLYDTRKRLEIRTFNQNLIPTSPQLAGAPHTNNVYLGASSNAVADINLDPRRLLHKLYDFTSEFKRIRLKSIKAFMILVFSLIQILISIQIIKLAEKSKVPEGLLCVILLFIVGTIFGLLDLFTSATRPMLNSMKLVSLIVTAASYRFLIMHFSSKDKMIGAAVLRLAYKFIMYYPLALLGEKILKKKEDREQKIVIEFYDSVEEREAVQIKRPLYIFQKFSLLQESDLHFAVISLFLPIGASHWLDDPDARFKLRIDDYVFYLVLVLVEMILNAMLSVFVISVIRKTLIQRAKSITVNLWKEFLKVMDERKWTLIGFKGLLIFVLLFIFFNEL